MKLQGLEADAVWDTMPTGRLLVVDDDAFLRATLMEQFAAAVDGGAPPRPDADGDALLSKLEAIQRQLDVLTAQRGGAVRAQPAAAA